jgi:hypothetical protein
MIFHRYNKVMVDRLTQLVALGAIGYLLSIVFGLNG